MITAAPPRRPLIVLVGGFLGAGKTTLICSAAQLLEQRGLRCAVILNDQGDHLVDTRLAEVQGLLARQVTGGCFCCRFSNLLEAIDDVCVARAVDVIFAEPVGSCTDISATVLGPLREEWHRYRVAPFTVLVDPARAAELSCAPDGDDIAFLFQKQLQEADLVCTTKLDKFPEAPWIMDVEARRLSAKTGEGVPEWLDEILFGLAEAGKTTLEIDYARYAKAEASLAWLNLSFTLNMAVPASPPQIVGPFLDALNAALAAANMSIVHLKMFDGSSAGWLKASLCANGEDPLIEGNLDASPACRHELLLNLRAKGDPVCVRNVVELQLQRLGNEVFDVELKCFSPPAPRPERRVTRTQN